MFWAHVEPDGECWRWIGTRTPKGYGQMHATKGQRVYAHRWAYERFVGPIAAALVIDHLCRNTSCVNPAHLEAVAHRTNIIRGQIAKAYRLRIEAHA